jgi:glycosyltransferase involved in cell wall biosynthesis
VSFLYSLDARRVIGNLLVEDVPDLAHLHIYYGQMTPSILARLKAHAIPIVQTLHEYKLICPIGTMARNGKPCADCCDGSFWRAAFHRCNRGKLSRSLVTSLESYTSRILGAVKHIDHFIAVTDFVRNTIIHFGISPDRISTVYNFIDVHAYKPQYKPGEYFLYFGRIEKIKGVMTLLAALKEVSGTLLIAGEGGARTMVEREVEKHSLDAKLVGFRSGAELHDLIRGSRCVVVPSEWYETFGLAILEANALGKPVIASRIGGMPEVVRDGETGILFESGNIDELAQAMKRMWTDPAEAVQMGRFGRKLAEDVFGKERHYEKIMSVYNKVGCR